MAAGESSPASTRALVTCMHSAPGTTRIVLCITFLCQTLATNGATVSTVVGIPHDPRRTRLPSCRCVHASEEHEKSEEDVRRRLWWPTNKWLVVHRDGVGHKQSAMNVVEAAGVADGRRDGSSVHTRVRRLPPSITEVCRPSHERRARDVRLVRGRLLDKSASQRPCQVRQAMRVPSLALRQNASVSTQQAACVTATCSRPRRACGSRPSMTTLRPLQ
jgi:hypothetical protein